MDFLEPGALTKICKYPPNCDFNDFVNLVNTAIEFLIYFSTFAAVVAFVYAGFKLLTSGGNPSAMTDAKTLLRKVLTGYIVILTAWLVVYTITHTLLDPDYVILQG